MTAPTHPVDALRRDILTGSFAPGERLVELQLTERYGCGRATIRSALVELATEGLVDREANRGASVRRVTIAEAIEITEARAALESLAAGHAAMRATEPERAEMWGIVTEMHVAVDADDPARYSSLNATLHRLIREASRHTVAAELVENLRNRSRYQQFQLAWMPGRPATSLPEHEAIVAAIVSGDATTAEAAMYAHLRSVIDVLQRWNAAGAELRVS